MKPFLFLIFSMSLAIISAGCASTPKSVLIATERDPHFSMSRSNAISMALRLNPGREEALLGAALMTELSNEHFNITTNADADYVLSYLVEDDSTVVYSKHTEIEPLFATPPQTTAQILSSPPGLNANGIYRAHTVSIPLTFTDKRIRLYLFARSKEQSKGLQIAWQGYIGGGTSITAGRIPFLTKTLLGYFGQDYTGKIDLKK